MKKKVILSFLLSTIIIFSATLPAFAGGYTEVDTWSLQSMYTVNPTTSVSYSYNSSGEFTTVTNNSASSIESQVLYRLNNEKWIAGQTYQIVFDIYRGRDDTGFAMALSTEPALNTGEQTYITNYIDLTVDTFSFSFTYTGQPYLCVALILPSSSSLRFGNFHLNAYNPNAELESQNQQIIEQNSELNSKLFEEGETYSLPEVDLSEQYSIFDANKDDLLVNGNSILQSNRIVNGVKAFAYLFTSFYESFLSYDFSAYIPALMYFSVLCSLILLILGFIRSRGDK